MRGGLLNEFESMLNVSLGAQALRAYVAAFEAAGNPPKEHAVTLWHLATVLPLVFHEVSRRAISKRRVISGLRSTLTRDAENDIAQNEVIFNLNGRMRSMYPRTVRSLNCAVAWGLLTTSKGAFISMSTQHGASSSAESSEIIRASAKLGTWAGQTSTFEYFTVLGVEFHQ